MAVVMLLCFPPSRNQHENGTTARAVTSTKLWAGSPGYDCWGATISAPGHDPQNPCWWIIFSPHDPSFLMGQSMVSCRFSFAVILWWHGHAWPQGCRAELMAWCGSWSKLAPMVNGLKIGQFCYWTIPFGNKFWATPWCPRFISYVPCLYHFP